MHSGILFSIDEKYRITTKKVDNFDIKDLSENQHFISENEARKNPENFLRDVEQTLIGRMRRKKVLQDLSKLGYTPGCRAPENAYYVIYGQPNVRNTPPSLYYEIEQTFDDMGWEYTGCPHDDS